MVPHEVAFQYVAFSLHGQYPEDSPQMLSEIYLLRIRGRAISSGAVANWSANLIVALSFLTLSEVLGKAATVSLYGVVSIGSWVFAFCLMPETKRQSCPHSAIAYLAGWF